MSVPGLPPNLACGVCMLTYAIHLRVRGRVRSAKTIIHGTAVCGEHLADLVITPDFIDGLKQQLEEIRRDS